MYFIIEVLFINYIFANRDFQLQVWDGIQQELNTPIVIIIQKLRLHSKAPGQMK